MDDISGKVAEAERETPAVRKQETRSGEEDAEDYEGAAEVAEWVHGKICAAIG
jgi:hypothetical protein